MVCRFVSSHNSCECNRSHINRKIPYLNIGNCAPYHDRMESNHTQQGSLTFQQLHRCMLGLLDLQLKAVIKSCSNTHLKIKKEINTWFTLLLCYPYSIASLTLEFTLKAHWNSFLTSYFMYLTIKSFRKFFPKTL